jgi:hypothetical protein
MKVLYFAFLIFVFSYTNISKNSFLSSLCFDKFIVFSFAYAKEDEFIENTVNSLKYNSVEELLFDDNMDEYEIEVKPLIPSIMDEYEFEVKPL